MSRLTTLGDALVGRLLRSAEAGACVPENGSQCTGGYGYRCKSGVRQRRPHIGHYNCSGSCVGPFHWGAWRTVGPRCTD